MTDLCNNNMFVQNHIITFNVHHVRTQYTLIVNIHVLKINYLI